MYKIYIKITLMCFPASVLLTYGTYTLPYKHCSKHDRHAACRDGSCIYVKGAREHIAKVQPARVCPGRQLNETCSSTSECSRLDVRSRCDSGVCRCKPGNHEAPTPVGFKCFPGTTAKPQCNTEKPCSSRAFVCTPWGVCDCRLPGYKAELLFSRWQCIRDPFLFEDRGTITFLKVSPVPLLVVVIILAYFGYQRKAKSPPIHRSVQEVTRLQQRRLVPLWRGVTFHPSTITQVAQPQPSSSSRVGTILPLPPRLPSLRVVVPQQPPGDMSPPPPYQPAQNDDAPPSYDEAVCAAASSEAEHIVPLLSTEGRGKT
ncbi:unnamed protein product [Ixodes hexagonus]